MLIIPAIDLKDGKCVRLRQGEMQQATVYGNDPAVMAAQWVNAGARRLHIVDLNGAFAGKPVNKAAVESIVKNHPKLPVQVGGGIRDLETVQAYLDAGVSYVIIGTKAIQSPEFVEDICMRYPGHIIVGLDAKNGKVAMDGWAKISESSVIDIAKQLENMGVESIIYTDISRDGMMGGVNIEATVNLARSIDIPIIASGGVSQLEDIKNLYKVAQEGIAGVVVGRAIYEGTLDLTQAQTWLDQQKA
jgi:phosphoribosylformimino-5-aminoimidazole carboxamide ribotide isomerase